MTAPFSDSPHAGEAAVALAAVREAGLLCRAVQAEIDPGALSKSDRSPVTVADFGSQALVCRHLLTAFPDVPVVAEENADMLRDTAHAEARDRVLSHVRALRPDAGEDETLAWIDHGGTREPAPRLWTLDPIDGTKGFLRGEHYAVALALIVEGELRVAAMACPNLGDALGADRGDGTVFLAVRGEGCVMLPMAGDGMAEPARVTGLDDPAGLRFCQSVEAAHSSHDDAGRIAARLGVTADGVRVDSQVKYGVTARGEADAYLRLPKDDVYREKIWDHAAGALVVTEAGGRVTDIAGRELDFSQGYRLEDNRGVIVTNGRLHDDVIGAIRELGIGRPG